MKTAVDTGGIPEEQAAAAINNYLEENPITDISDLVIVSNTEPTSTKNRIWVSSSDEQVEIPTAARVTALEAAVQALQ